MGVQRRKLKFTLSPGKALDGGSVVKDSRKNNAPETKASAGACDKSGTGVGGTVAKRVFSSTSVCVVFLSHNLSQSPPQKCSKAVLH